MKAIFKRNRLSAYALYGINDDFMAKWVFFLNSAECQHDDCSSFFILDWSGKSGCIQ